MTAQIGKMECLSIGALSHHSITSLLHYSILPTPAGRSCISPKLC